MVDYLVYLILLAGIFFFFIKIRQKNHPKEDYLNDDQLLSEYLKKLHKDD